VSEKKLTNLKILLKKNPPSEPVAVMLRTNSEVSDWLRKLFELRSSGEISMTFSSIAEELSEFLERNVKPRQVSEAFREWQREKKRN